MSVRPAGVVERVAKWAQRKPTLAAVFLLGMLAVLLGGLGGAAVWQGRAAEQARGQADSDRIAETKDLEESQQANIPAALALLDSTRADLRGWKWRYIYRLCHHELLTLKGHIEDVSTASFSPDGSRVVTASDDGTAKVWDASPLHDDPAKSGPSPR